MADGKLNKLTDIFVRSNFSRLFSLQRSVSKNIYISLYVITFSTIILQTETDECMNLMSRVGSMKIENLEEGISWNIYIYGRGIQISMQDLSRVLH